LKKLHRAKKAIYHKYDLPFPLSNRECYIIGFGADRFERNGSVIIACKGYNEVIKEFFVISG
jgi:hypothetical protein